MADRKTARYIVWNTKRNEGFVSDSQEDAETAATGRANGFYSTLAMEFYEAYGVSDGLVVEKVYIESAYPTDRTDR